MVCTRSVIPQVTLHRYGIVGNADLHVFNNPICCAFENAKFQVGVRIGGTIVENIHNFFFVFNVHKSLGATNLRPERNTPRK
jgi:hypothetical protein